MTVRQAGKSVLICDDELDLAEELGEFFTSLGWTVTVCNTGHEAMQLLQSGLAPACLLTDLRLGDMDGTRLVEVARRLPEPVRPHLVVVITGNILGCGTRASLDADLLLLKPIDPVTLAQDMEEMLSRVPEHTSLHTR
jgi:CheY-like chemotaxis protein